RRAGSAQPPPAPRGIPAGTQPRPAAERAAGSENQTTCPGPRFSVARVQHPRCRRPLCADFTLVHYAIRTTCLEWIEPPDDLDQDGTSLVTPFNACSGEEGYGEGGSV